MKFNENLTFSVTPAISQMLCSHVWPAATIADDTETECFYHCRALWDLIGLDEWFSGGVAVPINGRLAMPEDVFGCHYQSGGWFASGVHPTGQPSHPAPRTTKNHPDPNVSSGVVETPWSKKSISSGEKHPGGNKGKIVLL